MMQIIVNMLEKSAPDLLNLTDQLSHCDAGTKVSLQTVTSDMSQLLKDYNSTKQLIDSLKATENFNEVSKFLDKTKSLVDELKASCDSMEELFKKAVTYLGEDPKTTQPEEFFGMINQFIRSINDAVKQNEFAIKNAEKLKKREEARQNRLHALNRSMAKEEQKLLMSLKEEMKRQANE